MHATALILPCKRNCSFELCAALTRSLLCHRNGQPRQAGAKALPNGAIISEKDLENALPTKDVGGVDSPTGSNGHKTGNPTLEVSRPAGLSLWVAVTCHSDQPSLGFTKLPLKHTCWCAISVPGCTQTEQQCVHQAW